jgi:hypothetical protein
MIYALVHHRYARRRWAAVLASLPVLLDAYQLDLEQLIMSDTLFMFLLAAAHRLRLPLPLARRTVRLHRRGTGHSSPPQPTPTQRRPDTPTSLRYPGRASSLVRGAIL